MTDTTGPTSHTYFSQRLRLHYVDWGNESAPPLMLIHGSMDHCRNWDWVARALRNDYHIIAPDLRGHGDSQWLIGSSYRMLDYVYDIAQLVQQKKLAPVSIISHSMGASVSLYYAGLYPEQVSKLVAIEGLGPPSEIRKQWASMTVEDKFCGWIDETRALSSRQSKRYPSLSTALQRMQEANPHLSEQQARHLTIHGTNQNEDGTYSWKFDNYVRTMFSSVNSQEETDNLLKRIKCSTLLIRGAESWATDPRKDERLQHFQDASVLNIDKAGHWVHHDQLPVFLTAVQDYLQK